MEACALVYRFPPSELEALTVEDLETWGAAAIERATAKR